jgi:uncharacterized YccA/Bax inhibitor family protein
MPSPVLNDQTFANANKEAGVEAAGWAAPQLGSNQGPISDGPISAHQGVHDRMTMKGTMAATGVMFALLLVTAVFGWNAVKDNGDQQLAFPGWMIFALFGALGMAIFTSFKPKMARITGPGYALLEGLVLGGISKIYYVTYNANGNGNIVLTAVGATLAVFAVMWFMYATRIIKVTDKFRKVIIGATLGIMVLYLVSFLLRLFGATSPLDGSSGLSIAISVVIVGIAAFNLMLDFDLIERGVAQGAPKYMEWYGGFALMVTLVWLYLEILRLLAKLQNRR